MNLIQLIFWDIFYFWLRIVLLSTGKTLTVILFPRCYKTPYSPDFTPIEQAWSKLKTKLRASAARSYDALKEGLQEAIDWITSQNASNWFDHCGYHTQTT
ncbi:hypothetical protein [Hymenobacter algoricola]|uniref:Tc1-like transposase DDE domain-containing protein n=1 Tax=Hymenobacter algoricola TaxID=486267 RepID=A0ABP7MHD8_9BACT